MSCTPIIYSTQIGPYPHASQGSSGYRIILIFMPGMNQAQTNLMEDIKCFLIEYTNITIVSSIEIPNLPPNSKFFVIPYKNDEVERQIMNLNTDEKPHILVARGAVEILKHRRMRWPPRTLVISTSMHKCNVFLVKSLNNKNLIKKIIEMLGNCVTSFDDTKQNLNVVITDRADDRYCARARQRNIPVVSVDWLEETYSMSLSDDPQLFNHDAFTTVQDHRIKPFLGLSFKINIPQLSKPLRALITENSGRVAYGNGEATHIVDHYYPEPENDNAKPRVVDVEFLEVCVQRGHYMTRKEYREYLSTRDVNVKLEIISQAPRETQQPIIDAGFTPTPPLQQIKSARINSMNNNGKTNLRTNGHETRSSVMMTNNQMLPPVAPALHRQQQQQNQLRKAHIQDIIMESLDLTGQQQTQLPSTQIRRLPETEIQIERTYEPSQHLYWDDPHPRRY